MSFYVTTGAPDWNSLWLSCTEDDTTNCTNGEGTSFGILNNMSVQMNLEEKTTAISFVVDDFEYDGFVRFGDQIFSTEFFEVDSDWSILD